MWAVRSALLRRVVATAVGKSATNNVAVNNSSRQIIARNHGTYNYRCAGPRPDRSTMIMAESIGAFMWWWVLWHLWTEPEHVYGEFPYADPTKWTDAELGIPPDDEVE